MYVNNIYVHGIQLCLGPSRCRDLERIPFYSHIKKLSFYAMNIPYVPYVLSFEYPAVTLFLDTGVLGSVSFVSVGLSFIYLRQCTNPFFV